MEMRKITTDEERVAGVYAIINKKNSRLYIGSSNNIKRRWKEHLYALEKGKHHSIKLQRSYNRMKNKDDFEFKIVEVVDEENLRMREQYYIDLYNAYTEGYNCSEKVDNPKYAFKNQKKRERKKALEEYYDEFNQIYNDCHKRIHINYTARTKIDSKEYKNKSLKDIIFSIKWFLETYDDSYFLRIQHYFSKYWLTLCDCNKNEFAVLYVENEKINNSTYDTQSCLESLVDKGIYDANIHKIPDYIN